MKISDEIIDEMIRAGMVKAFGGTGEDISRVVATVKDCDEATVILRRSGKAVGVLVVADSDHEGATKRGQEVLAQLQ
jgi:hypothetical protein